MKKIFRKYFLILGAVIFASSCTKDKTMYEINQATAPSSGITLVSSTTNIQGMSLSTQNDTAVNFSWGSVWYGAKTPVTYTLQYDSVGKNFVSPTSYSFGQDIFQGSLTQDLLNKCGVAAGIPKGSTGTLEFRLTASIGTQGQLPVYSNIIKITFNTYLPKAFIYVPGDYQGWSPSSAPKLLSNDADNFSGYVYVPSGGSYEFKITSNPDWSHTNYGDGGTGKLSTSGGNLVWPNGAGYYQVNVTLSTLTWSTVLITTWGVIGDATPGGWGTSTPLTYNPTTNKWSATVTFGSGQFKFRANNAWDINLGSAGADGTSVLPLKYGGGNLPAPSAGSHVVTLDLSAPDNLTYSIQ